MRIADALQLVRRLIRKGLKPYQLMHSRAYDDGTCRWTTRKRSCDLLWAQRHGGHHRPNDDDPGSEGAAIDPLVWGASRYVRSEVSFDRSINCRFWMSWILPSWLWLVPLSNSFRWVGRVWIWGKVGCVGTVGMVCADAEVTKANPRAEAMRRDGMARSPTAEPPFYNFGGWFSNARPPPSGPDCGTAALRSRCRGVSCASQIGVMSEGHRLPLYRRIRDCFDGGPLRSPEKGFIDRIRPALFSTETWRQYRDTFRPPLISPYQQRVGRSLNNDWGAETSSRSKIRKPDAVKPGRSRERRAVTPSATARKRAASSLRDSRISSRFSLLNVPLMRPQ